MRWACALLLACQSGGDTPKQPPPAEPSEEWTTVDVLACRYTVKMPGQARHIDDHYESGGLVAKCIGGASDDDGVHHAAEREIDALSPLHGGIAHSDIDLLAHANVRYVVRFHDGALLEGRAIGKDAHIHVLAGIVTSEDERHDFARMLGTYKAF